jgi:2Fe-2S ferredoxin
VDRLPPIKAEEETILAFSDWREPNSRLSCQIRVTDDLEGLCVTVAPED